MRYLICTSLLLVVLLAAPALATVDAAAVIAAAPPASDFPDEDVVILLRSETVEVSETGLVTRRDKRVRERHAQHGRAVVELVEQRGLRRLRYVPHLGDAQQVD